VKTVRAISQRAVSEVRNCVVNLTKARDESNYETGKGKMEKITFGYPGGERDLRQKLDTGRCAEVRCH